MTRVTTNKACTLLVRFSSPHPKPLTFSTKDTVHLISIATLNSLRHLKPITYFTPNRQGDNVQAWRITQFNKWHSIALGC